ncbi:MAG: homoserine dehydrogenase [Lachnospirales bacterium]
MNKVKIGILGLGNVGQGVLKILEENAQYIEAKCGSSITVKKILVRDIHKKRNININEDILTTNENDILEDDEISIILELMGGEDFAKSCMLKAFKKGKHVVSANKMCISNNIDELHAASLKNNVIFLYEASVAGGIPIINGINSSLTANKIQSVYGIINGTTNYILTKMYQEGCSLEDALAEAKELGYAEEDPTSDIENFDAMYKLKILAKLCFGHNANYIYRKGITNVKKTDINYAKEFGYIIKSLAIAKVRDNSLELRVHPTMLRKENPIAHVNDSFNSLMIRGNAVGDLMFYGRGAGDLPTGSAVVSDLISILVNEKDNSVIVKRNLTELEHDSNESKFYIRLKVRDKEGVLAYITGELAKNHISVHSIMQKERENSENINLVLITHLTKEKNINIFTSNIENNPDIIGIKNIIHIEDN